VHTLVVRADPLGPLASPRLGKVVFPLEPEWTVAGWISGDFQRRADHWFSNVVEPRGWVIPLTNQILYTVFSRSYMGDRTIVVGRRGELYQGTYIEGYCAGSEIGDAEALAAAAARTGELTTRLASAGKTLVVLVTPSKAAVMPEHLPLGACTPAGDPSRRRRHFVAELRAHGAVVVDGHALTMAMKAEDPLPPFPRGGIHWSRVVGARVAGVVIRSVARDRDFGGVDLRALRWTASPEKSDRDLAELLTLFVPPFDYPVGVAEVVCRPTTTGQASALLTVGGSFLYQVLDPITDCGLFRKVEHYFYYDQLYQRWPGSVSQQPAAGRLQWRDNLAGTDLVVLEIAEHRIGNAPHFDRFVTEALAALGDLVENRRLARRGHL
jgi:alginate O-acetyltransferase complex protein AlgJ